MCSFVPALIPDAIDLGEIESERSMRIVFRETS